MGQAERPTCPGCGAFLILALPPGGKGKRTFQCFDCERPDPLKMDEVKGWLAGELGWTASHDVELWDVHKSKPRFSGR
jgi:hypothetical protein